MTDALRDRIGDWADLPFFTEDYPAIARRLAAEGQPVFPPEPQRLAALELTPRAATRVVILGQDPYPTAGHAHGLAFSAEPHVRPLPRSLGNIFKELQSDLDAAPDNGDLRFWARQGVLLLNTALTVPEGDAGGHTRYGWDRLTRQVLGALSDRPRAFVLWGAKAQAFAPEITGADHLILRSAHPSPLSARRGFFGSRPFSTLNNWLTARREQPINWTHPEGA
ncbi:uracil-DNA glycosylase [Pseudooceanicola aestuarii]|uniref:uracil-DNA glycosylase n=1 Tax=Pseudooceanicola aestuarii TaxID=2697319 RepID=UPI0013D05D6C|nr:uracil-DNA glycosylase [Pseudooceanicola aestuarii]